MHREISHTDGFRRGSGSYLFTGLLARCLRCISCRCSATGWAGRHFKLAAHDLGTVQHQNHLRSARRVLGGAFFIALQGFSARRIGTGVAIAVAFSGGSASAKCYRRGVVFIGMFGECLEAFTFDRTKAAIRQIVEVFPIRCWLLKDGKEERVFTKDLRVGDQIVVKPGAKVPVDGIVLSGRSAVDASPLTGESLPLDKGPGDEVLAGSINQYGALTIDARRVASKRWPAASSS